MRQIFRPIYTFLLLCLIIPLAACGTIAPTTKPSATPSPSLTATLTPTTTLTPTPTPAPAFAVLLAPPGADQAQVDILQAALNDIVVQAGLQWQVRRELKVDDLVPELRLVVAVPPDPGLAELISAAPDTQFLALGIPVLPAAPNLTTIGSEGDRTDQQGFIAGVIAAMLSYDWRTGVISLSDTVEGRSARTGFLNGTIYFCGLCRPAHPPFLEYPIYFELPTTATSVEWQEAANYMVDHAVETVYVFPGAGDATMLSILADDKVNIISSGEPPEEAKSSWVVSLTTDPISLIQKQVKGLLDGSISGGQALAVPIQFTQLNPLIFTPGKQKMAEQVLSDLQAGFIDTGVDLTTGEQSH